MRRIFRDNNLQNNPDYKLLVNLLVTYQRQGEGRRWEDYRNKIPPQLLKIWGDILIDCRRNGFINPKVEGEVIIFYQIITTNSRQGDLCTFCDRDCRRREQINSGELKAVKELNKNNPNWREQKPCWAKGGVK